MLVDPQHQYIVFWNQFLKGGFYTGKNRAPPTAEITRSNKRRFLHSRRGNFCFTLSPASMHTILIQAPAFSDACAKRGYYTGKISYKQLSTYVCTAMLSRYRKSKIPPCTICSRNRQYTEKNFENRDSSTAKKRFLHAYFGWLGCSNLFLQPFKPLASGVEISFAKCFFLSAGMWKPLFLHIIINK